MMSGFAGAMAMTSPSLVTVSSGELARRPFSRACLRSTWTASITSCGWLTYASPRADVQERFRSSIVNTDGNCVSAFTLGSHEAESAAAAT